MHSTTNLSVFLVLVLAACNNTADEPGDLLRSGKADNASAMPEVLSIKLTETSPQKLVVEAMTPKDAPAFGFRYFVGNHGYGGAEWRTAYGGWNRHEAGKSVFRVEVEVSPLSRFGYVRYAMFSDFGGPNNQVWNNNDGNDFFFFSNAFGGPVGDFTANLVDDKVEVKLSVANFSNNEQVTLVYELLDATGNNVKKHIDAKYTGGDYSGLVDFWTAEIPLKVEADQQEPAYVELRFNVEVKIPETGRDIVVAADNFGHGFRYGIQTAAASTLLFDQAGYEVMNNSEVLAGGTFTVRYERPAKCISSYRGCQKVIEVRYRFYDDDAEWMTKMVNNCEDGPMISAPVYIPRDAKWVELWFRHTGSYPPCEGWDSNGGNNYIFPL